MFSGRAVSGLTPLLTQCLLSPKMLHTVSNTEIAAYQTHIEGLAKCLIPEKAP